MDLKKREHLAQVFHLAKQGMYGRVHPATQDKILVSKFRVAILRLGGHRPRFPGVVTHQRVDIDAVACTTLGVEYALHHGNRKVDLTFLPKGWVILDHPMHLATKGKWSAFGEFQEGANPLLVEEIDECDGKRFNTEGRFTLEEIFEGQEDLERLYLQGRKAKEEAESLFPSWLETVRFHDIGGYEFMEILAGSPVGGPDFAIWIQNQRPNLVGSIRNDNWNLGVMRYPSFSKPSFKAAHARCPGWYLDSRSGFLLAWGTRKKPALGPPPPGTPQSVQELIDLLRETVV